MRKKGFTLIELLVVIAIIAMLLAILMPALNKVKKIAQKVICGTNLKGLGTAQVVYANDYDDDLARQGGAGATTWGITTSDWFVPNRAWGGADTISVASSLYLLVREADVNPKSFVCPSSDQNPFDPTDYTTDFPAVAGLDFIELWDFGNEPQKHVSYSYHLPYGAFPVSASESASFGLMADRNPLMDPTLKVEAVQNAEQLEGRGWGIADHWNRSVEKWEIERANAEPHDRTGQNVAFADGHCDFETTSDVAVKHDNIYTPHSAATENGIRQGDWRNMTVNNANAKPVTRSDSVLVNDAVSRP